MFTDLSQSTLQPHPSSRQTLCSFPSDTNCTCSGFQEGSEPTTVQHSACICSFAPSHQIHSFSIIFPQLWQLLSDCML